MAATKTRLGARRRIVEASTGFLQAYRSMGEYRSAAYSKSAVKDPSEKVGRRER